MHALRNRPLTAFYLATPVFMLLDYLFGWNIRVAFLAGAWKLLYYLATFGAAFMAYRRPRFAPVVGIIESSANILLLILGVMLPIMSWSDGISPEAGLSGLKLINFLISGTVLAVSFYRNQRELERTM